MKTSLLKSLPLLITAGVLGVVLIAHQASNRSRSDILTRLEWMAYDLRVKLAYNPVRSRGVATNLACVYLDDFTVQSVATRLGLGPVPPRFIHGYALDELAAQGAKAAAFDVWFDDVTHDCEVMRRRILFDQGVSEISSDEFLARSLRRHAGSILSAPGERDNRRLLAGILPLLRTNVTAIGHTASERDADGVYRRVPVWVLDRAGNRVWNLGIVLAARELGLDLDGARVVPGEKVSFRGTNSPAVEREIQLLGDDTALIDWNFRANEEHLHQDALWNLVDAARARAAGKPGPSEFAGKLVLIGSIAHGNNMADRGATPLLRNGYLMHTHINVASSLISGRLPRRAGTPAEAALIIGMTVVAGIVSWRLRVLVGTAAILALAAMYAATTVWAWTAHRYWLPLVLPLGGALIMTHVVLVTYRVVFERAELRRVRTRLRRLVAPDVMQLVLDAPIAPLSGTYREVTVMFADLRGFTELTDSRHRAAVEEARRRDLPQAAAQELMADMARESMETVNAYLAVIAETVKAHGGTLDKYIGDCVMSFWGAPLSDDAHAVKAVRAAIAAQRKVAEVNARRTAENLRRAAAGLAPLPLLEVGIGLNTGAVTAGFMGSEQHISNYTVFGREVNVAARLEGLAPASGIRITAATHAAILRADPALASQCRPLESVALRGIAGPVEVFGISGTESSP